MPRLRANRSAELCDTTSQRKDVHMNFTYRRTLALIGCTAALWCMFLSSSPAQETKRASGERSKAFTIDDIFVGGKFSGRGIRGFQWIEHGKAYSYLETDTAAKQTNLWRYDIGSGKKRILVAGKNL